MYVCMYIADELDREPEITGQHKAKQWDKKKSASKLTEWAQGFSEEKEKKERPEDGRELP